jgi:uncharacterized protein (DUF4415 family)
MSKSKPADERPVVIDDENPKWTKEDFARAKPLSAFPELEKSLMKGGRPSQDKQQVTLQIDRAILHHRALHGQRDEQEGFGMPELVEPIGRLRNVLNELEVLCTLPISRAGHIGDALCHLQYAIDLLDGAQPSYAEPPIASAHAVEQSVHPYDTIVREREKVDPLVSLGVAPLDKSKLH